MSRVRISRDGRIQNIDYDLLQIINDNLAIRTRILAMFTIKDEEDDLLACGWAKETEESRKKSWEVYLSGGQSIPVPPSVRITIS